MAYEKRVEPIAKYEIFLGGLTLQLFIIFFFIIPWLGLSERCLEAMFKTDIQSIDEVSEFHDCLEKQRGGILTGCTCLLIGYVFIISHIYYDYRIQETLGSFLNFGLFTALYTTSWGIAATILCTVMPALGIFIVYYDWEWEDDYQYVGYVMQFQLTQLFFIIWDCLGIPLGLAASIPWLRGLAIVFDCCKSKHYKLTEHGRDQIMGCIFHATVGKWLGAIILLTLTLLCFFAGIGDALDFAESGFWSYQGGSQFLEILLFISWEAYSIILLITPWKLDSHNAFLNENVESMAQQDTIQMTQR